jgi:hypothetical protein
MKNKLPEHTLLQTKSTPWQYLKRLYGDLEVSEEFVSCADAQLTAFFEDQIGMKAEWPIVLSFATISMPLDYQRGEVSRINGELRLKYSLLKVNVAWESKTPGKIYGLGDVNFDCGDLKFWIEGLDKEKVMHFLKPKWTLLTFLESSLEMFKREFNLDMSLGFAHSLNQQLTEQFERLVGVKVNKEIGLNLHSDYNPVVVDGVAQQKFTSKMYINHNWNPVTVCWRSKSGRVYTISDRDVDPNDIEFWFEGIDPVAYHKQLYPNDKLPFKIKDLPFELNVLRLNMNCNIAITLHPEQANAAESLLVTIGNFIDDFNQKSEKRNRANGVVHSHTGQITPEGILELEVDTGFSGPIFLKNFLKMLAKYPEVAVVEVG